MFDESQRKQAEAEFHDTRERDKALLSPEEFEARYSNNKFYSVVSASTDYLADWLKQHAPGKRVLDYCCGTGGISLQIAELGGSVYAFDISAESVQSAARKLSEARLRDRGNFMVMDAERLAFEDASFDTIVVSGVLHHLDVDRAYPELARVLKPGGRIICMEALGYNPVINLYRRLTPKLRTAWETEHILTLKEVDKAKRFFRRVDVRFFHLAVIAAIPFRKSPIFKPLVATLNAVDAVILRIPLFRRMAWQMFFELSEPRSAA